MKMDSAGLDAVRREPDSPRTGAKSAPLSKRALDLFLLVLFAPGALIPMVLISVLIKLVSRGPVFFSQERIGYLGRPFTCWKFRTMHLAADNTSHQRHTRSLIKRGNVPMRKLDAEDDPRVIRFGGLLRASGLDELPQLFNVLMGQMSMVGPRPCVRYEYDQFSDLDKRRFETLPGLTGLWQVNGKNRTTFDQMIALDIEYVERRSLWLDLEILARTAPAVLAQVKDLCQARARRRKPKILMHE